MPTALLDLEATAPPSSLPDLSAYDHALVLLRREGQPVGQCWLPVTGGHVDQAALATALETAPTAPGPLPPPAPPATVAVCTRDRPDDLRHCLAALACLPDDGQEVLVVDNAPSDGRTRTVVADFPRVRYGCEPRPGLDRARNHALRIARHPIVAFVDDDAAPDPGWLRALCRHFHDPAVLCVTGLTMPRVLESPAQEWFERYSPFGRGFERRTFDRTTLDPLAAGRAGAGANMALRRAVLRAVGPFDVALDAGTPTHSGGDTEMFSRILAAGHCIVYDPAALCWHRHRRSWPELRRTLYGYGVGVYALWTRRLLREREWRVLPLAATWLLRWQLPALARALLRRPGAPPADLLLAELCGCAVGPWAYLRATHRCGRGENGGPTGEP